MIQKSSKFILISASVIVSTLLFVIPLVAASIYSFKGNQGKGYSFANYLWLIHQDGFFQSLVTTLKLAILAGALNLILMVPTMVFLNLKGAKFKPLVDFLCILPLIIPVVSLAIGAQVSMPSILQNTEYELVFFYVVISLPFTFRALDNALQAVSLNTLVEASRNLGATWFRTIVKVIVPSIKSGIFSAMFLTFALSIGEYTITSLLHWDTFSTWTVVAGQQNILGAIAISIFSFVGAIALLTIIALFSNKSKKLIEVKE